MVRVTGQSHPGEQCLVIPGLEGESNAPGIDDDQNRPVLPAERPRSNDIGVGPQDLQLDQARRECQSNRREARKTLTAHLVLTDTADRHIKTHGNKRH